MVIVIDTNVPVVANGKSSQATPICVKTCSTWLRRLDSDQDQIAIDDQWLILKEYKNNLKEEGQPGLGDAFLKWLLTNLANQNRCKIIKITPTDNTKNNFEEFPDDPDLIAFDPSDRKFIAVSLAHPKHPPILQAVDSKWWELRVKLEKHVKIEFLCQEDVQRLSS